MNFEEVQANLQMQRYNFGIKVCHGRVVYNPSFCLLEKLDKERVSNMCYGHFLYIYISLQRVKKKTNASIFTASLILRIE